MRCYGCWGKEPEFDVVALTRRTPPTSHADITWVRGDLAEAADVRRAADGCDAAFLVCFGNAAAAPPVLDALVASVQHVVYLSTASVRDDLGEAGDPITVFHTAIERDLRDRDVTATMLRSGGIAGNAMTWSEQIRAGDEVRWVLGDLARPLVHEADLADVALVAAIGAALGHTLRFVRAVGPRPRRGLPLTRAGGRQKLRPTSCQNRAVCRYGSRVDNLVSSCWRAAK